MKKNVVIFDKDSERDEQLIITKPEGTEQPTSEEEARAMPETNIEESQEPEGFFARTLGRMFFGKPKELSPDELPTRIGQGPKLSPEDQSFFDDYMKDRYGYQKA